MTYPVGPDVVIEIKVHELLRCCVECNRHAFVLRLAILQMLQDKATSFRDCSGR